MRQNWVLYYFSFLVVISDVFAEDLVDLSKKVVAAVNCGGDETLGAYNILYEKDTSNAGTASDHGTQFVFPNANPKDVEIYQTERWSDSNFEYNFPLKEAGFYVIILKFSEVYFKRSHQKVFDVSINNHLVVENLDIFQKAGGTGYGYDVYVQVKISRNEENGSDEILIGEDQVQKYYGNLKVEFLKGAADNPKINAIVVLKGKLHEMPKAPEPVTPTAEEEEEERYEPPPTQHHQNTEYDQEYEETYEEAPQTSDELNPFERELDFKYIAIILIIIIFIPVLYLNRNQRV
ncbi:unnamed protein product [Caenorhabditis angaria]|uniref:Malectin domain-containing protein n=1 Tax=Caenorhabditis angaria TaxID=860376 RepID=A0A9P1II45_9PELO|nr:unnamed protein product [Caenorhabditis angaria]